MPRLLLLALLAGCQNAEQADDTTNDTTSTDDTTDPSDTVDTPADTNDTTDTTPPDDTPTAGTSPLVDPQCTDGQYAEVLADPSVDLSAARAAFDASAPEDFLIAALDLRYPIGAFLFEGGFGERAMGNCLTLFTSAQQRRSADGMLDAASTLTHECGHFFDLAGAGRGSTYHITDTLTFVATGGGYDVLPARSLIKGDAWYDLRPACPANGRYGCDSYAQIYLNGTPGGQFESGDQGLDMLMEETVQYVNSLATDYAFEDNLGRGVSISARDGILTFLWYTERYLNLLRTTVPNKYNTVLANEDWRDLILTVWGRAWLYLDASEGMSSLGLDDADLMELVTDPELLAEIQAVRDAQGCP